jgi:hypothetical protein
VETAWLLDSINHIEGCQTGTNEVEFARRLAWNGSERNSSSGSQQIALAGGWLCSLESIAGPAP